MGEGWCEQIQQVFLALRREEGFVLGIDELLAALQAEQAGFGGETPDSLAGMLELLWCKSEAERGCLRRKWEALESQPAGSLSSKDTASHSLNGGDVTKPLVDKPRSPVERPTVAAATQETFGVVLTYAPPLLPADELTELTHYYPVSGRVMRYSWRYLRRMVADGAQDVLDVESTVAQAAQQGFYCAPVLRRRERNHAHLILLLDQLGSMVPFHHYLRDLVETAQHESGLGQTDVYYFRNVPQDRVYPDERLLEKGIPLSEVFKNVSEFTSILIVSDAGVARGHNDFGRVIASLEFLDMLEVVTRNFAWLNPMPESRWRGTSAEIIARHVAMFEMSPDGLSNAVDALRGLQPVARR